MSTEGGKIAGARVLLVEDDASSRLLLSELIRGWSVRVPALKGCEVTCVPNGDAAVPLVGDAWTLLITDLCMPGSIDGVDLVRHVRARGLDLPILVYSGRASLVDFRAAYLAGADHVAMFEEVSNHSGPIEKAIEAAAVRARYLEARRDAEQLERLLAGERIGYAPCPLPAPLRPADVLPMGEVLKRYIEAAAKVIGADPPELAARLGVSEKVLRRLVREHGVERRLVFKR